MALTKRQQDILGKKMSEATDEDRRIVEIGRVFTRRVPYGRRRHATLTAMERADWDRLWVDYKNDGYNDEDASHLTWHYLQRKHPRLLDFDDAYP